MRVLILGGSGMLGHKCWQVFQDKFDTFVTLRRDFPFYAPLHFFNPDKSITHVDALHFDSVLRTFHQTKPDVVVNCIGLVKQAPNASDPILNLHLNALFPHKLARLCHLTRTRLIHISTDCVFSGKKGLYTEEDVPDATNLYGRCKLLGEVTLPHCLILRTSLIGRQLFSDTGLVEWFLKQEGKEIEGYKEVVFSGFTTISFARILANVIEYHPQLAGLYHVSSDAISKYDLLCGLKKEFIFKIQIEASSEIKINRSLASSKFRELVGFIPAKWSDMTYELVFDNIPYQKKRRNKNVFSRYKNISDWRDRHSRSKHCKTTFIR